MEEQNRARFGAEITIRIPIPVETQEEALKICIALAKRASAVVSDAELVEVKGYEVTEGEDSRSEDTEVPFWNLGE